MIDKKHLISFTRKKKNLQTFHPNLQKVVQDRVLLKKKSKKINN